MTTLELNRDPIMSWHQAVTLSKLENGPVVFKHERKQIALFRSGEEIYAVDNRCPHEGYPLIQGQVSDDCVLTCAWHNWKFRLQDGECILGGDNVRSYPVKVEGEHVYVNLESRPLDEIRDEIFSGLRKAFNDRDYGRICREVARLHFNEIDPLSAVRQAIEWTHDRLELGTTHAFAASADWLTLYDAHEGDWGSQLVCLAESIDHMADDALRFPPFPFAKDEVTFDSSAFLDAVENEQLQQVESMTQNAPEWSEIEETFATAALAHLNDFGHSLIYVLKSSQLLDRLNLENQRLLTLPLARHLCYTTREDLLPPFRAYREALSQMPKQFGNGDREDASSLFGMSIPQAVQWCLESSKRSSVNAIYDALLTAISRHLLHFDTGIDQVVNRPPKDNVSWLHFTHGITFSNAARHLCGKYPHLWPQALLQMACFLGRNQAYLDHQLDESEWMVDDATAFFREKREQVLDHGIRAPIYSAHLIKTLIAVEEEAQVASKECQRYLLAGLNRFLSSPIKQKQTRRFANQANKLVGIDFVG